MSGGDVRDRGRLGTKEPREQGDFARGGSSRIRRRPPRSPPPDSGPPCGTPIPLLRLPIVFPVRNRTAKIAAAISFVVVLPTDPVTAASRKPAWRRFSAASFCRASSGSGTTNSARAPRNRRRDLRHEGRPRSFFERGADEFVAVDALSRKGDKKISRLDAAGIDRDALHLEVGPGRGVPQTSAASRAWIFMERPASGDAPRTPPRRRGRRTAPRGFR